ncbi:alpha/beta hydrolase [Corynebacterium terpenotabidum]|uniref:AB hydrolase-1 domain-containing protein n=1 Tax=Corynebacterium terpenotabidum Y-11 TaxID=1200352 RepID=S4XC16_9CORY|nr:alpha/beta hydrolase [Corynebacterium terpenotabidum]AGP30136.1 hypothetical protein A606_02415 [Corynebacterium terpenotabidum Y-11]
MSAPRLGRLLGRLLDRLPDNAWTEDPHRRPLPRTDDPATRPVVLIHGAVGSRSNFTGVVPELRDAGHPVLSVSYGHHGTADLTGNFAEVRRKLAGIVADAGPVDLVGHSQGGLLALAASGTPDLRGKVGRVVGIAADVRGVTGPRHLINLTSRLVPAWRGHLADSPAMAHLQLYAQRSTVPFTQILSTADLFVPADRARAFLDDDPASGAPAHRGRGRVLEVDGIRHEWLPYSRRVGRLVAEVLAS